MFIYSQPAINHRLKFVGVKNKEDYIQGRGAQINPQSRFDEHGPAEETFLDVNQDFESRTVDTQYIEVFPRTILNKVESPDIGMAWSMNPYQGCEHGCVYCYARNSHTYWGYSAGIDFESRILVKKNAPELLDKALASKSWTAAPIMFSGNTDCYQPVEKKLEITRKMLEVLWKYRHPVGIITKNSLVCRDIDILSEMAKDDLVQVVMSINGVNEQTRLMLEPRTATFARRFETIRKLSEHGIPCMVMVAPVIPGLNDPEIIEVVRRAAEAGARSAAHIVVRLNGAVKAIFEDWLEKNFPDRAAKIIHKISEMHGGKVNDSEFGRRMKGEGHIASIISDQLKLARKRYMQGRNMPRLNTGMYELYRDRQMTLF